MKFKALTIIPHNGAFEIRPLVRCKECRWWKNHGATSETWLPCMETHTSPDWFCADGEKGEDDGKAD